jgi:hypothetical protein
MNTVEIPITALIRAAKEPTEAKEIKDKIKCN